MTVVSGDITIVTETPALITEVRVHAPETRTFGDGVITTLSAPVSYAERTGEVLFNAAPGPAILSLKAGSRPVDSVPLLVPDTPSATLRECVEAALLADEGTISALERLAQDIAEGVARVGTAVQVGQWATDARDAADRAEGVIEATSWEGDRLTVHGKTSPSLTGPRGPRGPQGVPGPVLDVTDSSQYVAKSYVDAQDQALGERITDEKWWRPGLSSSSTLDDLTGASSVGLYPVTGAVGGLPGRVPGTVHISYDSSSARTVQVYAPSSPAERVTMRRVYQGTWRDWEPTTYSGLYVSTGHVDDLIVPHVYAVAGTVAGLPVAENTSLEVMQAGAGTAQLIQRATTLEVRPRTFVRRRQWSRWDEWVEDGKDTSPAPITWDLVETTNADAQLIAGSMSHDRLTLFNSVGGPLRQSRDNGQTWEEVYQWPGSALEVTLPLANGEILVVTNSAYEGQTSMRRVWVSEGYDPDNPQAATWVHKLTGSSRMVKFPEWSLNTWDNIVLASEYGPKGGMIWAGNPDPIEEGKNARYAYLSTDYGETWKRVFDLNSWLRSRGENTLKRHIHGIAWDPYWDRIWLTFGDHPTDNGSNGILYSDDFGDTWEIAYHSAEVDEHLGFQVVGIQPMRDCVLFAGDMTPAGAIRVDRAGGKYRDVWEFPEAWSLGDEHKLLCHVIRHHQDGFGEVAFFGFAREGSASPSIIVATRDGYDWDLLWESDDAPSPGFRWMVGPTMDGQLIASVSRGGVWSKLSGKVDLHNFTQSQLAARDGRFAAHRELVMTPEQVGRIATEKASGKADTEHTHTTAEITDLHHYSGTGFPEGKVTAPVGAIYTDRQATAGAVRWIKTQGTGNTGWVVEYGDTGWRKLDGPSGEYLQEGEYLVRREGRRLWVALNDAVFRDRGSNVSLNRLPLSFRGPGFGMMFPVFVGRESTPSLSGNISPLGYVNIYGTKTDSPARGYICIATDEAWPSTLPGTPA